MAIVREVNDMRPRIAENVFLAENATVLGDVRIGKDSSIWYGAILRGDVGSITIGERSNIQDGVVIHATQGESVTIIGNDVSVGHNAVVHGCTVGTGSLIGMGAVVLNRARIGKECLIGAGSVVLEDSVIPDGSLVAGNPAKVKRQLTDEERRKLYDNSLHYMVTGRKLKKDGYCI